MIILKKTNILIISGFLGSGKTTFIKKYISDAQNLEKTVIIENEFGEVSIDGEILKKAGLDVKEINSGCICCSVSGSFKDAIKVLKKSFDPDTIIVEPSGVAKLSEIETCLKDSQETINIQRKITIIDPALYHMYLANFGEFYLDQIKNADIILFSRLSKFIEENNDLEAIKKDIYQKNSNSFVLDREWDQFSGLDLLTDELECLKRHFNQMSVKNQCLCGHDHHLEDNDCSCGHKHDSKDGACNCGHDHHLEDDNCSCGHDHHLNHEHAHENFESISLETRQVFSKEQLRSIFELLSKKYPHSLLRAKGLVKSEDGFLRLNYVPGEIKIEEEEQGKNTILVFIGKNLNEEFIRKTLNSK